MYKKNLIALVSFSLVILSIIFVVSCNDRKPVKTANDYTGSESCIECHEHFYELWSTSHHGLAMQPITGKFITEEVKLAQNPIQMEGAKYQALQIDSSLVIREDKDGEITDYRIVWALGGKNTYYFLTELEKGKLQTLPLAFNVNTQEWYNNPESAIRHFPVHGQTAEDEALPWKHRQYTFNTACYSCHVSQLENNYDLETNTYETNWKEAGINCETCHGPSGEHVVLAKEAARKGEELTKLGLISTNAFTPEQHNASCAGCHAKMHAITPSYMPGDKYFDNFGLITLEDNDFYPDGRDLGENYTMTGWHMNPCVPESDMHCVTCHTSSGRYRFASDDLTTANRACTSCHEEKEELYEKHTHHKITADAPKCIDCHMPMTMFGHMNRSDHSFRPPMPKATMEFGSPNACNLCHDDRDAEWSQKHLEDWGKDEGYQEATLKAGRLILAARNQDWDQLPAISEAIKKDKYGEVFTTSLLRLIDNHQDELSQEAALSAMHNESPLVRSAAAQALYGYFDERTKEALLTLASDELRLVRLSAAISLSLLDIQSFTTEEKSLFDKVNQEYKESLVTRPDDWSSHYNLGNHYQNLGELEKALQAYNTSYKVYPEAVMPLVNSSLLYSMQGNQQKALENLSKAREAEPMNEAVNFNYALLMAELGNYPEAEDALKRVVEVNKKNAAAAYNLAVIMSQKDRNAALKYSKMAAESEPENPKYPYTYAFYLNNLEQEQKASEVLNKLLETTPDYAQASFLLGAIYEEAGKTGDAKQVYLNAIEANKENAEVLQALKENIRRLN